MPDLDLRKLRYFLAVAEELNYGRAAERLHIAQPVLSRQITALERELGVALFDRSKRGTTLTDVGTLLVEDARALLNTAGALQRRARAAGRSDDRIAIGFMPGIIVTPVVRELRSRFPSLVVDVIRTGWDTQVELLHDGTVDASFVRLPVAQRGLRVTPLFTEPRVAVLPVGHPLLEHVSVTMTDLATLDLLQDPDAVPEWRDAATRVKPTALAIDHAGLPALHTVEEKLEHVAGGAGLVILPESTARFYTRPDVAYRAIDDLPGGAVAIAIEATRRSSSLDALVEIATEQFSPATTP
ncbi:LysR family transcriptional regulator [Plantibacter sp. YIM 135347]|uniref:LysR family transcriptional regulator n=1 Tax=Plantibacter sp. YIM 135347 TaxID=3423919 RepID=UPI003D33DD1E